MLLPAPDSDHEDGFDVFDWLTKTLYGNHAIPDGLRIWICLISMAVATLICCVLAIFVLWIFRYRKLKFESGGLHWIERACRLFPLMVFMAGTVNICIYFQVVEAYLYFGNISGENWRFWASLIFLGGVVVLGFIFQLTEFPDKRKRTFQERFCDFVHFQAIFGPLLYLALFADILMALTSSLLLHVGILLAVAIAMLNMHYGSIVWLIRVTGFTIPTEAAFDTACAELASRLGLKYRPTIVVARWSFINAFALPWAGMVLIPSELFRVMDIPEILAVVAHEFGHLRESFWQKFRRIVQSAIVIAFLTSPFWVEDLGNVFYPPTPKNAVATGSITANLSDLFSSLFAVTALVFVALSLCMLIWSWCSKKADEKMGARTFR